MVKPDAAGRLFERLAKEADEYAARIGGDTRLNALYYEIGALHAKYRELRDALDVYSGANAKPQRGCGHTRVFCGDASVLIEYEYEPGEDAVYDVESPGVGPGCAPSVSIIGALVNGVWIDPQDAFDSAVIERWEQQILDDEIAVGREQYEDRLAERDYA